MDGIGTRAKKKAQEWKEKREQTAMEITVIAIADIHATIYTAHTINTAGQ